MLYGCHVESKEAKPRAIKASDNPALELEATPSKSYALAHGHMPILMAPIWNSWCPKQEAIKPLQVLL